MDTWLIFHDFCMFLWRDGEYLVALLIGLEWQSIESCRRQIHDTIFDDRFELSQMSVLGQVNAIEESPKKNF